MGLHLNPTTVRRLAILAVLLLGFAVRLYAFDTTYIDPDRANVHGIGLVVLDTLLEGKLSAVPLFSDPASIMLPNGPLVAYLLALVAVFDRSLTMAVVFSLMLNMLVVPLTYVTGKRLFGWGAGLMAATLIAVSNWAVYMARGTWHPTYNEVGAVLALALFVKGIQLEQGKYIVAGFGVCALVAGGDMKGFALPAQAAVAATAAGLWRGKLRSAWLMGIVICIGAGLAYLLALYASGQWGLLSGNNLVNAHLAHFDEAQRAARDISDFNRDAVGHLLRLASNADYGLIWTNPTQVGYALKEFVGNTQALVLGVGATIGLMGWGLRLRVPIHRFLLAWAAVLVLALYVLLWRDPDFRVPPYYLLTASPVPHLAVASVLVWLLDRVPNALRTRTWPVLACCAALAVVPIWNFVAAAQTVYTQPLNNVAFMPLRWNNRLGDQWRAECTHMTGVHEWWELSMMQSAQRIVRGGARNNDFSSIHAGPAEGGDCALRLVGRALPNSEVLPLTLDDGSVIPTYRARPFIYTGQPTMTVNIGWSLLEYRVQVTSPSLLTVRHVWRIEALPDEPFGHWYFAPYARLIAADGQVVAQFESAASMEGWEWRVGSIVINEADLRLPPELSSGRYTVQSSLYDPNQHKNAVYFDKAEPGKPILTLEQAIDLPVR